MATGDPWAAFRVGQQAPSANPYYIPPDPILAQRAQEEQERKRRDEARANAGVANEAARTGITVRGEGRDVAQTQFNNYDTLRQRYDANPAIRQYREVLPLAMSGLKSRGDATGDNALIYAYAKIMDPGSVVREGEADMAASGASWVSQTTADLKRQMGAGGRLPDEVRQGLRREINQKVAEMGRSYVLQRERFGQEARDAGLDPDRVLGPHDSEPFRGDYYRTMGDLGFNVRGAPEKPGKGLPTARLAEQQPIPGIREPTRQQVFRDGIQWDIDRADSEDSRAEYLAERYGVDPGEEAAINAMWNANVGNPDFSVEAVEEWYRRRGIGVPERSGIAQMVEVAKKGGVTFEGSGTEGAIEQYNAGLDQVLNQRGIDPTGQGYAATMGGTQGVGFNLLDEITGAAGAVDASFRGDNPFTAYQVERDVQRRGAERAREANPWTYGGMEVAGSLVGGAPAFRTPARLAGMAKTARGLNNAERAAALQSRAIQSAAARGGAAGGLYGFGGGEGLTDSLTGAGIGGAAGAGIGAGVQALAPVAGQMLNRMRPNMGNAAATMTPADRYAAGQRFGMDLSIGDVRGRGAKMIERTLDAQAASAQAMNAPRERLGQQAATAAENVADTFGPATSFRGMGEAAQTGAKNWMSRFDKVAGKLYDAIPIKPNKRTTLNNTRAALRELTDTFASNPELRAATENSTLIRYRDALEQGNLSWQDLKAFRTQIGEQMGEALLSDGTRKGQLKRLYAALSQDMEATARAQGGTAYRAFQRANDTFAAGQQRIEGVISSLIGNAQDRTPEAAAQFLQRIAREGRGSADLQALAEVRRTLKPEEWAQVSNSFLRLMGQPANSAGREFNPATFVRVYDDMAPEARNLLFGGQGKALRQNLEQFTSVIRGMAKNDSTRNVSGTAYGMGSMATTGSGLLLGNAIPIPVVGPLVGALTAHMGIAGAGKLWTNPAFVRWATGYSKMLANASRTGRLNRAANDNQMKLLSRFTAANSAVALEARQLQQQLMTAFDQGALPLAAQDRDEDSRGRAAGTR